MVLIGLTQTSTVMGASPVGNPFVGTVTWASHPDCCTLRPQPNRPLPSSVPGKAMPAWLRSVEASNPAHPLAQETADVQRRGASAGQSVVASGTLHPVAE